MRTSCRACSRPPSCCWHRTRTTSPRSPRAGSARASATAGWAEGDSGLRSDRLLCRNPQPILGSARAVSRPNLSSNAAIAVLSIIFLTWGGLTSLNDVLIPHLKAVFEMNYARTMLIQFTFFSTYLVMSLPVGRVMARVGYRPSMVIGLIIAALGALAFYPAAKVPSYPLFLLALFVLASGITLAQALNSLGHTLSPALIGPLILSVAVLGSAELAQLPGARQEAYRIAQAQSVQLPHLATA